MLETLSRFSSWFNNSAPPEAVNDVALPTLAAPYENVNDGGSPASYGNDSLGSAREATYQEESFHYPVSEGFAPSWVYRQPPGVGDAPQHVYSTYNLAPISIDGPGDRPASYLIWKVAPIVANFAVRQNGMAVDGGSFLLTGLYVPEQMQMMSNDIFPDQ